MKHRILLVEDEPGLVMTLTDRLSKENYEVQNAGNGKAALDKLADKVFDLILLDIMLPYSSGLEVCQDIRRRGMKTPILMLTAKSQVVDKVIGLKLGADDYLTKPFEMIELLARVEALLRRAGPAEPSVSTDKFQFGDILVNFRTTEVFRAGQPIKVSAREFKLLRYFIENIGTTISREELLNAVWGYNAMVFTRTVDVHVAWLRQKIEPDPRHPRYIHTLYGLGYRFIASPVSFEEAALHIVD
jgi:two-component system, OmpR family, alkaline phosphatase synthesis response regulator PhoP